MYVYIIYVVGKKNTQGGGGVEFVFEVCVFQRKEERK